MLRFIIPLFALLTCTEITQNVWECRSDDTGYYPGMEGVDTDDDGNYICTNCVQISESECLSLKQSIVSALDTSFRSLDSIDSNSQSALVAISNKIELLSGIDQCPYHYCTTAQMSEISDQPGYDSSLPTTAARLSAFWSTAIETWQGSNNSLLFSGSIPSPSSFANASYVTRALNYLVGVWDCTYSAAVEILPDLHQTLDLYLQPIPALSQSVRDELGPIGDRVQQVTCSPCTLGNANSGGGGSVGGDQSGVETGCLSCYLDRLDDISETLSYIDNRVESIETKLSQYIDDVKDKIKDNLDIPLSSISNVVQRIDDYLRVDQDQLLDSIRSAVIVISNEVSDIQHDFYEAFKRADESKNLDDEEFDLVEAINEIPNGGDSVWSRLNWFSRMEALLGSIAGFGTNTTDVSTEIPSEFLQEYDTNISSVNSDSSGLAARDQISGAMDTISSVLDSFRIFDGVYEPESIRLLDSSELPFLSGDNGVQLTVEIPEVPAIYSFLRFARYAFIALYWSAALLAFFFALLGLYTGVVSLIKWASQFLGSVFSS